MIPPRALILTLAPLLASHAALAGSVRLRAGAAIEPGQPVRVGDVATLEGADALALAPIIILNDWSAASQGKTWARITIADLSGALDRAGARTSTIALSGSTCDVRVVGLARSDATTEAAEPRTEQGFRVFDVSGTPTVRKECAASLAASLGVEPDSLRLAFDSADAEFLDAPRFDRRIVAQPVSAKASARSVVSVRVYDHDRLEASRTVRVEAEVRRDVAVLTKPLRRKDVIRADAFTSEERWMPAGAGEPISRAEDALGRIARTDLPAGTVLGMHQLDSPVVVRRNELVTILAIRAGFEVQMRARARTDGKPGETIEFRAEGSKKPIFARVEKSGVAVLNQDAPEGAERGETP